MKEIKKTVEGGIPDVPLRICHWLAMTVVYTWGIPGPPSYNPKGKAFAS